MAAADAWVQRLWTETWHPSADALRYYGSIVDAAANDLYAITAAPTTADLERARHNLDELVRWLGNQTVGQDWARQKQGLLCFDLALLTVGAVATLGGPITILGVAALVGSSFRMAYDVADIGFKSTLQPRIQNLLGKIGRIELVIRAEIERR
jgi:hypothetical protein